MTLSVAETAANLQALVAQGIQLAIAPVTSSHASTFAIASSLVSIGATDIEFPSGQPYCLATYQGARFRLTLRTEAGIYPGSAAVTACVYFHAGAAVMSLVGSVDGSLWLQVNVTAV